MSFYVQNVDLLSQLVGSEFWDSFQITEIITQNKNIQQVAKIW